MTQNCVAFMRFLTPGDCRGSSCGEICLWNAAVPRIGNANLGVERTKEESSIECPCPCRSGPRCGDGMSMEAAREMGSRRLTISLSQGIIRRSRAASSTPSRTCVGLARRP